MKYYKKAIHLYETKKIKNINIASLYNNLGSIYIDIAQDTALYYLEKGVKASIDEHNLANLSAMYQNLGVLYDMIPAKKDSAEYYLFKALDISKKLEKQMQINTLISAGDFYFDRKQYDESKKYFSHALNLANEPQKKADKEYILSQLYRIEKARKNYKNALEYLEKQSDIKDSLDMKNTQIAISKLKEKYEVEKGKKEIELLKNQNKLTRSKARLHQIGWYSSLFILGLFIIIGFSSYSSYKHKQIAKEQRLMKEAERRLLCAVIETEDAERQRFAEDIHDGVNPLLSSIKLYLGEMKYTEKEEKEKLLDIADEIINEAITQVREISHNIKPDKLTDEGLFHSLGKFVEKIRYVKKINIDVRNETDNFSLPQSIQLILYRTLVELINNTIKHAEAKNINISFSTENNRLVIRYTDDGKGFDTENMHKQTFKGIGLQNIKNRIESINGKLSIDSEKGKGMRVEIIIDDMVKS